MSGTGRCPCCQRPVIWCKTRRGRNIPLDTRTDPAGVYVPFRGRAWLPDELLAKGEPWSDFAEAGAHTVHIVTCPLWPRPEPGEHRGSARGHLACHACGVIDTSVRHTPAGDRCADCRATTAEVAP